MHRIILAAIMTAPLWATAAQAADETTPKGYTLVFEDSFSEDSLAKFDFTDPKAWGLVEEEDNTVLALQRASKYTPPVRSPVNIAWVKDLEVDDFVLDVRAKQTGREYGHRDLCLFFGRQDASKFYYVHLASVADEHANSIFLVNDKPRVSIAEQRTDGTTWTADYHHIRLVRDTQAGLIEVYFDDMDKPVMKAVDRHFGKGSVGIGSFDDVGHFDDLKLYAKGETP